jgi:hypothetical protein
MRRHPQPPVALGFERIFICFEMNALAQFFSPNRPEQADNIAGYLWDRRQYCRLSQKKQGD